MDTTNDSPIHDLAGAVLIRLPVLLTPFVDREAERALLAERLADPALRLVTITGAGGSGKTRLAIEAARTLSTSTGAARFTHGVVFVTLAALAPAGPLDDAIAMVIAAELGLLLDGPEPPPLQLQRALRERAMLLILDNVEHLAGVASFVAALLPAAPQLVIIATSREPLALRGEWLVALDGLAFPGEDELPTVAGDQYPALVFFSETARRVAPDFVLDTTTLPAVIRICRLLDGLPLGIELAANWLRVLSCTEVAAEIAAGLDFLATEAHDLAARQRSLRAVFNYSWELLTPSERQALCRLAIFSGSFTREAAAAVADAPLPRLASLVNKSLVRRVGGAPESGAPLRYELPQTLRQYAAEELARTGELPQVAARHTTHYLGYVAARTADLRGSRQRTALDAIEAELEAIRLAWGRAVDAGASAAIALAAPGLFHFFDMRSRFQEGAAIFAAARRALDGQQHDPAVRPVWATLLAQQAWFVFHIGRQPAARQLLERSVAALRCLDAPQALVFALNYLAAVCSYLGEYEATERLCAESLAIAVANEDDYGCAVANNILGQSAYDQGDYVAARSRHEQSMALERRLGNQWSLAFSLTNLGKVAFRLARHDEARTLFVQSLRIREEIGDRRGVAICYYRLGETAAASGDTGEAAARYVQSLALSQAIGNQWGITNALIHLAQLAADHAQDAAAAALLATALPQALEAAAIPQLLAVFNAAMPLLRRSGAVEPARLLSSLLAAAPADTAAYEAQAGRLQEWLAAAGAGLSLEQALGIVTTPVARPPRLVEPSPHGATFPGGLTRREVEVLRLVARGLTDAQVAEQLVISRRTVSTHLTAIYGKLQVASRSAATRFAVENGLV